MADQGRRDFIGMVFGGVAAVGGVASLYAMKRTWDPLPSVMAAGFTTVDLSPMKEGEFRTVQWRGKPIFILKKSKEMKKCDDRDLMVGNEDYLIAIGLCTHLGCIPAWEADKQIFKCACHGGEFDACGVNTFGPPPRPLDIPPFKIEGTKLVLGEEGPEYKKLVGKA
ncbi:ubiquinol-cytochrome c reductase iron-sulfur subunit [Nitrosophilus alvini]|uniref:ubiquinol-cytochrome c reductase iron-sulfur subunit n=1 Tax=Nitrosophilus alvini TaxID=2714855 RepID=UPI0019090D48|nr:ubiquinol-cytochrome c reductase iron-sulfur subunit [Nitrosophilus alvini]